MSNHLFTYAIGDIYGDHALLTTLLDRIHDHADGEDYRLVFLGNAIDHGPNGAAVLSALRSMELRAPDRVVALRGWHESLMADARGDREAFETWMANGGHATLRSFGVTRYADLPREVVDWVARRPVEFRDGARRFVSDPGLAEEAHDPASLESHLVHGAGKAKAGGPDAVPLEHPARTDIDTGAGFGGCLTAAIFTDLQTTPAGFFQALPDGRTRFLEPLKSVARPWDPRLALKVTSGEPETATQWCRRQDADLVAAQAASKRRAARRRTALATAAGLVVVVGGSALLWRPALRLVASSMAPHQPGPTETAALPASSPAPDQQVASAPAPLEAAPAASAAASGADADAAGHLPAPPAPPAAAAVAALPAPLPPAEPQPADAGAAADATVSAPGGPSAAPAPGSSAPEAPLRTHALPAPGEATLSAAEPAAPDPAATSSTTAAPPEAQAGTAGSDSPVVTAAIPTGIITDPSAFADPAVSPPARVPVQDSARSGDAASGTPPSQPGPAADLGRPYPATTFALALDPSRRLGWSRAGMLSADPDLARLGLSRQASIGQPILAAPFSSTPDSIEPKAEASAPLRGMPAKPKAGVKAKPAKSAGRPSGLYRGRPANAGAQDGPIDLRALMDAPQVPVHGPRRRGPAAPAPALGGELETQSVGSGKP